MKPKPSRRARAAGRRCVRATLRYMRSVEKMEYLKKQANISYAIYAHTAR